MRSAVIWGLFWIVAGLAQDPQPANRVRADSPVPQVGRGVVRTFLTPGIAPGSLQDLVDQSALIVNGVVESVPSARLIEPDNPASIETDHIVRIVRLLKGPSTAWAKIVVSEAGGKRGDLEVVTPQFTRMQPGEHYVLFLIPDSRQILPDYGGLRHFTVTGIWSGKFEVRNNRVHLKSRPDLVADNLRSHDNQAVERFEKQILDALTKR